MSETPIPGRDPIDDFLSADFSPNLAGPLREQLLKRTTGLLRRRRWLRRLAVVAALAACYAAGILTMQMLAPPSQAVEQPQIVKHVPEPVDEPRLKSEPPAVAVREPADDADASALTLEWKALDSPERRPDLFRKAGDRYVEESDIPSALRCYRNALDLGTEKDWKITADDNWLFMALKEAKLKEKRNATDNG